MNGKITRRRFVAASAATATAIATVNILTRRADAAEFTYKYANNSPVTHPMTIRMTEAATKIKEEIERPARNPDLPQQPARRRHRHAEPGALGRHRVLHPLRPHPGDAGAGRLDQRHRLRLEGLRPGVAGDGRRARRLCPRRRSPRPASSPSTRCGTTAIRQITVEHQADQHAPTTSRASRSACRSARCGPRCSRRSAPRRPASISARSIRRCRPRSSRARRTRSSIIQIGKLYEVQKYCSHDQPHVGRLLVPRQRASLGRRCRRICRRSSTKQHQRGRRCKQREDINAAQRLARGRSQKPRAWCSTTPIRSPSATRCKKAGFYKEWKDKYGAEAWALLEKYAGSLA